MLNIPSSAFFCFVFFWACKKIFYHTSNKMGLTLPIALSISRYPCNFFMKMGWVQPLFTELSSSKKDVFG